MMKEFGRSLEHLDYQSWLYKLYYKRWIIVRWQMGQSKTRVHLEKEMATHSSIVAWEIPWTEEIGRAHV